MNFTKILIFPAFLCSSMAFAAAHTPVDSVGVEHIGKTILVLYKVEPGETLFALARKYNVSVQAIKAENPNMNESLKVGEIVRIPYAMPTAHTAHKATSGKTSGKIHHVATGEGLYSVARKYKISVNDLKAWNQLTSDELKVGQELVVSKPASAVAAVPVAKAIPKATTPTTPSTTGVHTVASGEGLATIAQLYQVSVSDLKKWNNLPSSKLKRGQELVVVAPETQVAKNTSKTTPEVTVAIVPPPVEKVAESSGAKPMTVVATTTTPLTPKTVDSTGNKEETARTEKPVPPVNPIVVNTSGYVKTVESGVAEAITEGAGSDLFLALHRTAPVGTIMQVRNEMNDQSVFVKVIGRLPDTGDNNKVLIKISKRAYERLGAIDRRFRVQVSYMPQQ